NVLRAGLTAKPIDVPEMLACVDYVAAPPIRIAPERIGRATDVYYAPVDDFELGITRTTAEDGQIELPGRGPRVIMGVEGRVTVTCGVQSAEFAPGNAVFVRADDPQPHVSGTGVVAQADVP
nr:mannose-6-phosphate isomerase, class I [Actinomycetales bacterium]